jgi:uncharacterized membrane protein
MRTASLDLVDYDWLFIETILALKDFDGEAEESMKAYINDQVALYKHFNYIYDYLSILIFLAVAGGFAVIFSGAAYVVAVRRSNGEKTSECGFDPFDDARSRFDVRFYLVALLFLVMDLEICFVFHTV